VQADKTKRRGIRPVRLDGNQWPWMTLKVVTRYCG